MMSGLMAFEMQIVEAFHFQDGRTVLVGPVGGNETLIRAGRCELLMEDERRAIVSIEGEMLPSGPSTRRDHRAVSTQEHLELDSEELRRGRYRLVRIADNEVAVERSSVHEQAFELGSHGRVRLWWDELPGASYAVAEILATHLPCGASNISGSREVAVEYFSPRGGRALYGLLGAHFTPATAGGLAIEVAVSVDGGQPLESSLASRVDDVAVSLPRYNGEAVTAGAAEVGEMLGSGVLRFDQAAHGLVGSAPGVFRTLARAIVHLLAAGVDSVSADSLQNLLAIDAKPGLLQERRCD
jgi:hypothetical protein